MTLMNILFQEEFEHQSIEGHHSLERIYKGHSFEGGPIFSSEHLTAAKLYCQRFSHNENGAMCLIIREKSFLRIWSEVAPEEPDSIDDSTLEEDSNLEEETSINSFPVQAEFADFCQKLLAEYIGPIAGMICKKTLAKRPNLTRTEFVEILCKKIPDPLLVQKFKEATLE